MANQPYTWIRVGNRFVIESIKMRVVDQTPNIQWEPVHVDKARNISNQPKIALLAYREKRYQPLRRSLKECLQIFFCLHVQSNVSEITCLIHFLYFFSLKCVIKQWCIQLPTLPFHPPYIQRSLSGFRLERWLIVWIIDHFYTPLSVYRYFTVLFSSFLLDTLKIPSHRIKVIMSKKKDKQIIELLKIGNHIS